MTEAQRKLRDEAAKYVSFLSDEQKTFKLGHDFSFTQAQILVKALESIEQRISNERDSKDGMEIFKEILHIIDVGLAKWKGES